MRRILFLLAMGALLASAQQINPALYNGMRWRLVGPFRAGRVAAVAGVPGDAATYYIGNPDGGVWKTTSGGVVWKPIFDSEPVSSIGAIAVAPGNHQVIYVGTGDVDDVGGAVNQGDGIYKSNDGGATWQHVGLEDTRHIGALLVDPRNADIVLAAALGHTFASNPERGVFRTDDGGRTWRKVLYQSPELGAISLAADPDNFGEMFAALEPHAPQAPRNDPAAGIYKSTDGGRTWTQLVGHGLPASGLGRIGLAVAAHTGGKRVFAITQQGLYRSDDAGASWNRATSDPRVMGSGYFSEVYVAPDHPDVVYVVQTSLYRSTDGGHTFVAYKGAPGGDDYHEMWIDPTNDQRMILGVDQGATISLNGGRQWSLGWYNLPNGQFYHIAVDNRFPYWIYGTQQDSGSAAVAARGDFGETTFMDWRPSVGAYEFGYIQPDLSDSNFVFATGGGAALNRYNWTTRQILDISPPRSLTVAGAPLRFTTSPEALDPNDSHTFYLGAQAVLATRDRGLSWMAISPDLTQGGRAAITALAPENAPAGAFWAGTSDGQVQVTHDGESWRNVTPPALQQAPAAVEMIETAPDDAQTAWVAVERHAVNDFAPYIYRTRDGGATWALAVRGIPAGDLVRVVRADPQRNGLLYAGTETGVYVSFNGGDGWQPLQLNLPRSSVRDLRVHGNDLIAATYGRALWILDDLSPLREISAATTTGLYRPAAAMRIQPDVNYDTPFPPEMATGTNPPAGAVLDYYLAQPAKEVSIEIQDAKGRLVRKLTSDAPPPAPAPKLDIPNYWLARPQALAVTAGMHRVVWDLRYPTPHSLFPTQPIAALEHDTPTDPRGPFVAPGAFTVRLTVDGRTYTQPLHLSEDPRVTTSQAGLERQRDLGLAIAAALDTSYEAAELAKKTGPEAAPVAAAGRRRRGAGNVFAASNAELGNLLALVELSDDAPTQAMEENYAALCGRLRQAVLAAGKMKAPACD